MKLRRALSLVLFVLTLGSLLVQAVSQGPNYAGAASLTVGWSSAANATGTPDGACASRSGAGGGALDLTNFGFTIPDAAVINGITVEVKFAGTTVGDDGVGVRLLKGGSPVGNTQDIYAISGQNDCSTSAFRTVGSPADPWGTSWTASDINAANFGVRLSKLGNTGTSYVDSVRITVEYQDVMTVTVISGGALTANVNSAATVESGKVEFLSQNQNGTTLKVVSTKNWRVRAIATVTIYPAGADDPTANAVEIKDYLGNFTPAGAPGVIVAKGTPTPAGGVTVNVDLRVMLDDFGDGKIGTYQFTVNYSIEEDI
jgi:hypothetical protein